jgi:AcrR family transcriptional regulator
MPADSAPHTYPPSQSADLTAKARIRNAAFTLHARRGESNTTLREVAQAAGVTHGLVAHHFKNKDGLRRAVQEHMLALLREALNDVPLEGAPKDIGRARDESVARMYAEHPDYLPYLRRALLDPDHVNTELLNTLADFTLDQVRTMRAEGVATARDAEHVQALAIVLRELAPRLLEPAIEQLWRHLAGPDVPVPTMDIRIHQPARAPEKQ